MRIKMKRVIPLIILFLLFVVFCDKFNFLDYEDVIGYNVTIDDPNIKDINFDNIVSNGDLCHIFTSIENKNYVNKVYKNKILSETFVLQKNDYTKFLKEINFKIYKKYCVEDLLILEGYSNKYDNYIIKNNCKFNIQVCVGENVKVGYPYIAEGF